MSGATREDAMRWDTLFVDSGRQRTLGQRIDSIVSRGEVDMYSFEWCFMEWVLFSSSNADVMYIRGVLIVPDRHLLFQILDELDANFGGLISTQNIGDESRLYLHLNHFQRSSEHTAIYIAEP